jgi:hypothetical protein
MVLAGAVMRAGRGLRLGLCAGALAAAAHAQIEMTAVTPGSCAWLMVVVGVAGGMMGGLKSTENTKNMEDMKTSDPEDGVRGTGWIGVSLCVAFVGWLTAEMPGVVRWERALREGYERVAVVAELEGRMRAVETGRTGDTRAKIVEDLAGALGEPGLLGRPLTGQEVGGAVLRLRVGRSAEALRALQRAGEEWPTDVATVQAWSRLELLQASQMKASGGEAEAREHAGRAVAVAEMYAGPRGAAAWSWLGTTREAVWELTGDRGMLEGAVTCWEKAAAGAPHAVLHPLQLARGCARLGRKEEAGVWARRALENDAKTRLDPLAGLSAGARKEMEGLAR